MNSFRRWIGRRAVFATLAVVTAAACGGSTGDGTSPVAARDFATAYARTYCEHLETCCTNSNFVYDEVSCRNIVAGEVQRALNDAREGGEAYDSTEARGCVERAASYASACSPSSAQQAAFKSACGAFLGSLEFRAGEDLCSGRSGGSGGSPPDVPPECLLGETVSCTCRDGSPGTSTCAGSSFGPCACSFGTGGVPAAGGVPAFGGAGGAGGAGGVAWSGGGAGGVCAVVAYKAEAVPVDMYVMFDQSSSMNDPIPGSASRWWDAAVQGVSAFVNDPRATGIGVGIQFFPYANTIAPASCTSAYSTPEVAIGLLPGQAAAIVAAVSSHGPSGFTPTGPALQGAIDYMKQWGPAHPGRVPAVVFVTDGFPTECEPSQISDIAALARAALETEPRVRTFVLGFSSGLSNLSSIAQAGGTGDAFLIEGGDVSGQFVQAMLSILGTAMQCEFELPIPPAGVPLNADKVAVGFIPNATQVREEVPRLRSLGDCALNQDNGWYYDSPTQPTKLLLCSGTCNRVATGVLNIEYGCDPTLGTTP